MTWSPNKLTLTPQPSDLRNARQTHRLESFGEEQGNWECWKMKKVLDTARGIAAATSDYLVVVVIVIVEVLEDEWDDEQERSTGAHCNDLRQPLVEQKPHKLIHNGFTFQPSLENAPQNSSDSSAITSRVWNPSESSWVRAIPCVYHIRKPFLSSTYVELDESVPGSFRASYICYGAESGQFCREDG